MNNADKILEIFTNNKSWSRILYQFTWKHLFTWFIFWNIHFLLNFQAWSAAHSHVVSPRWALPSESPMKWALRSFSSIFIKKRNNSENSTLNLEHIFLRKSYKKNLNFCLARPRMRLRDSFRGLHIGKDHHQVHDRRYSAQVIFCFQANTRTNVFQRVPRRRRPWSVRRDHHGRGTWAVRFSKFLLLSSFDWFVSET